LLDIDTLKYFNWLDKNAFVIESGKYFEVLGQISFDFDEAAGFTNFQQQWVNTSVSNFIKLSGKTESTFETQGGLQTKKMISNYYNKLGLNKTLGCSPGYFSPYANNSESLYNVWINQMIQKILFQGKSKMNPIYTCNQFTLRSSVYKGEFKVNDVFSIIPFKDVYFYVSMTGDILQKVFQELNKMQIFYKTDVQINPSTMYWLVCSKYDSFKVLEVLHKNWSGQKWTVNDFPSQLSSTDILEKYASQYWPCP